MIDYNNIKFFFWNAPREKQETFYYLGAPQTSGEAVRSF